MWLYYVHTCGKLCYSKNVKSIVSFSAWIFLAKCAYIITWFQEITEILTKKYLSFLLRIWDSLGAAILVCSLSAKSRKKCLVTYLVLLPHIPVLFMTSLDWYRPLGAKRQHSQSCFCNFQTSIFNHKELLHSHSWNNDTDDANKNTQCLLLCSKYSLGLLDQILVSRLGLPRMPISCTIRSCFFYWLSYGVCRLRLEQTGIQEHRNSAWYHEILNGEVTVCVFP